MKREDKNTDGRLMQLKMRARGGYLGTRGLSKKEDTIFLSVIIITTSGPRVNDNSTVEWNAEHDSVQS